MTPAQVYLQGPGLALAIDGNAVARAYFAREYGSVAAATGEPAFAARFERVGDDAWPLVAGHYKLARWRVHVCIDDGAAPAVGVRADVLGPLGLPLVQSQILEPLVGAAAARHNLVLVPGALLLDGDGRAVLLVAASGAGKTTLAARALAAGRGVLADDRVFLDAAGTASSFARRMRLYPDVRLTAPAAWAALDGSTRARLRATGTLRRLSAGRVAPHVAVHREQLAERPAGTAVAVQRVVLLDRVDAAQPRAAAAPLADALDEIQLRVRDDRGALEVPGLLDELVALKERDRRVLESALAAADVQRLQIPRAWAAQRAVQRIEAELGLV